MKGMTQLAIEEMSRDEQEWVAEQFREQGRRSERARIVELVSGLCLKRLSNPRLTHVDYEQACDDILAALEEPKA